MADNFSNASFMVPNFGTIFERDLHPYSGMRVRVPFYLTSSYRRFLGIKGVQMKVNPDNVTFRQNKRISVKDTHGGKVFFHWTNRFGRNNDILELEFSGQTGNISLKTGARRKGALALSKNAQRFSSWLNNKINEASGGGDENVPDLQFVGDHMDMSGAAKLMNFWNLYSLTREPVLEPETGKPVLYYISYTSTLLGNTYVTFVGHFSRGMDITDDAANPNSKRYSFSFTAVDSFPKLDYIYSYMMQNLSKELMMQNELSGEWGTQSAGDVQNQILGG